MLGALEIGKYYRGRAEREPVCWQGLDALNQRLFISTHETVLPTLLRNFDRYSMSNGVEIRMPFMDHRVVSFAFALPWESKIRKGYSKAIVRDALAQFMPQEVVARRNKVGFNSPIVDWMKGPLRAFMLDTIGSQSFKECQLIDSEKAGNAIRDVINNPLARFSQGERAWVLIAPYLWERAVIQREAVI